KLIAELLDKSRDAQVAGPLAAALAGGDAKRARAGAGVIDRRLRREGPVEVQIVLARELADAALRLPAEEAAVLLMDQLTESADPQAQEHLARGLGAVLPPLPSARSAGRIVAQMGRLRAAPVLQVLAQGMARVAPGLTPTEAARVASALADQANGGGTPY